MKPTIFFIDHSALKGIFEGNKEGVKLMKAINDLVYKGKQPEVITTQSCFLRAIYLCNPKKNINFMQKSLNFLEIGPSHSDFKVEKEVMDEVIEITKEMSKRKRDG